MTSARPALANFSSPLILVKGLLKGATPQKTTDVKNSDAPLRGFREQLGFTARSDKKSQCPRLRITLAGPDKMRCLPFFLHISLIGNGSRFVVIFLM
jgi:hypothetical protein